MAARATEPAVTERADRYLAYLESAWLIVPDIAKAWPGWPEDDRLDLAIEWGIREDRLAELRSLAAEGSLTRSQAARLKALERLVARMRPTLDQLLCEGESACNA